MSETVVTYKELDDRVQESEDRIIARIDAMDTRVNGRIRKLEKWVEAKDAVGAFLSGKNWNPVVIALVASLLTAVVLYAASFVYQLGNKTDALCQAKQTSLATAYQDHTYTFAEYNKHLERLAAEGCK